MIWPNSKKIRELAGCKKDTSVQKTPASSKASVGPKDFGKITFMQWLFVASTGVEVEGHCLFVHERVFWVVDKMGVWSEKIASLWWKFDPHEK